MEKDMERIEAYLDNRLTAEESRAFEREMASDDLFRQEVAAHKAVREAIVDHELINIKAGIRDFIDHQPPHRPGFGQNGKVALGIGGALIIGLSAWWLLSPTAPTVTQNAPQPPIASNEEIAIEQENVGVQATGAENETVSAANGKQDHRSPQGPTVPVTPGGDENGIVTIKKEGPGTVDEKRVDNTPLPRLAKRLPSPEPVASLPLPRQVEPVQPANLPGENCFPKLVNDPFSVVDGCKSGSIEIDNTWIQKARSGELDIVLLPDSIRILEGSNATLNPGVYTFSISGKDNCQWSKIFTITGNRCNKERKAFSPFLGEKWVFQMPDGTQGRVDIVNKSGAPVKRLYFTPGQEVSWDGFISTGDLAPMGAYFYVVTGPQGQKIDQGTIHLVR